MTWPTYPLGQVADTALGKMLDKGKPKGLPHVPYLRNINVQWGRVDTSSVLTMELGEHEHERFGLRAGDLLICEGGEPGRCAVWQGSSEFMAFQKALHRARPGPNLTTGFLRYYLEYLVSSGAIAKFCTGSTIAHLPQQQLRRVPVPLPPVAEQQQIVEILEEHLSRLDAADADLRRAALRAGRLREVAAEQAWRNSSKRASIAELGRVTTGSTPKTSTDSGAVYPFVTPGDISRGLEVRTVQRSVNVDPTLRLRTTKGEAALVVCIGATLGKTGWTSHDVAFNQQINAVHVEHPCLDAEMLSVLLSSPSGQEALRAEASATTMPILNKSKFLRVRVPDLDAAETHSLRLMLEAITDAEPTSKFVLSKSDVRSRALRRAVLAAAFDGKLTGRHTDVEVIEELRQQ